MDRKYNNTKDIFNRLIDIKRIYELFTNNLNMFVDLNTGIYKYPFKSEL